MKKKYLLFTIMLTICCLFTSFVISFGADTDDNVDIKDTTSFGDWFSKEYVDDFGDATGEVFYGTKCFGKFDNTATTGSDLTAIVFFEPKHEKLSIRLLEYDKQKASYLDSSDFVFKYKIDDEAFEGSIQGSAPNDDLSINSKDSKQLVKSLLDGKDIKVAIYIDSSKYNFIISGKGFDDVYNEAEKHKEEIGISGIYYENGKTDGMSLEIICDDNSKGTITRRYSDGDTESAKYTYDEESHFLTTDDDDTYFIVDDYLVGTWMTIYEGSIPAEADESTFDAVTINEDYNWECIFNKDASIKIIDKSDDEIIWEGAYLRDGDNGIIKFNDDGGFGGLGLIYDGNYYSGFTYKRH